MLEIKDTISEMKNSFRLSIDNTVAEEISKFEYS